MLTLHELALLIDVHDRIVIEYSGKQPRYMGLVDAGFLEIRRTARFEDGRAYTLSAHGKVTLQRLLDKLNGQSLAPPTRVDDHGNPV